MARNYCLIVFIILQTVVTNRASVLDLYPKRAASIEESAKLVKSYINESVDPCKDYTAYICNGPEVSNEMTPKEIVRDRMVESDRVEKFFLEYETDIKAIYANDENLRDFLKSCRAGNQKQIVDVLKDNTFLRIIKSWPIFDPDWNAEKFDIVQLLGELRKYGFDIGINVRTKRTFKKDVLHIQPAAIYNDFLIYSDRREEMLRSFGINNSETITSDSASFFKVFSKIIPDDEENNAPELKITYGEFKKNFSDFDWDRYFRIFSDMIPDESLEILVVNPERIKAAIATIENIEPRKLVNFIFLQFAIRFDQMIDNKQHTCYNYAFLIFQPIISRILVDKYYNDDFKNNFLGTMDILLEAIEEDLHLLQMPHDVAMEKLEKIINEEFLPSLDETYFNKRFKGWKVETDNFYGNVISFYPKIAKEITQHFFNKKGLEEKILNVNFISYLITKCLFDFEKKPSVLQYDSIAAPVIIEVFNWLQEEDATELEETISESVKEQFKIMTNSSIGSENFLQSSQYYLEKYRKWAEKNQDVITKEDEVLSSYGLSNMKVLFSAMRNVCPWRKSFNDEIIEVIAKRLANSDAFVKEYNCLSGDTLNHTE